MANKINVKMKSNAPTDDAEWKIWWRAYVDALIDTAQDFKVRCEAWEAKANNIASEKQLEKHLNEVSKTLMNSDFRHFSGMMERVANSHKGFARNTFRNRELEAAQSLAPVAGFLAQWDCIPNDSSRRQTIGLGSDTGFARQMWSWMCSTTRAKSFWTSSFKNRLGELSNWADFGWSQAEQNSMSLTRSVRYELSRRRWIEHAHYSNDPWAQFVAKHTGCEDYSFKLLDRLTAAGNSFDAEIEILNELIELNKAYGAAVDTYEEIPKGARTWGNPTLHDWKVMVHDDIESDIKKLKKHITVIKTRKELSIDWNNDIRIMWHGSDYHAHSSKHLVHVVSIEKDAALINKMGVWYVVPTANLTLHKSDSVARHMLARTRKLGSR